MTSFTNIRLFFLSAVAASALLAAAVPARTATLAELRKIAAQDRRPATTGRLIYVEQIYDRRLLARDCNAPRSGQPNAPQSKYHRVELLVDSRQRNIRLEQTDLRDLSALNRRYQPSHEATGFITDSKLVLIKDMFEMQLASTGLPDQKPDLTLVETPSQDNLLFDILSIGVIDENLLADDANVSLAKIEAGARPLLRITVSLTDAAGAKEVVIDCDPQLDYRFREIRTRVAGRLIAETIADEYTNVGGVSYPFLYIERAFDETGELSSELIRVFEQVDLGPTLSKNDFRIPVPAGTKVSDAAIAHATYDLNQPGDFSIDDIVKIGARLAGKR